MVFDHVRYLASLLDTKIETPVDCQQSVPDFLFMQFDLVIASLLCSDAET